MKYTYDTYGVRDKLSEENVRLATTTNFEEARNVFTNSIFATHIIVYNNLKPSSNSIVLWNSEDILGWQTKIDREEAWKPMDDLLDDSPPATKPLCKQSSTKLMEDADKPTITGKFSKAFTDAFSDLTTSNLKEAQLASVEEHFGRNVKDHINPTHYQGFFGGEGMEELQWLEAKQYEGQYKDPVKFKAAVSLQIEKYLDRNGGKDKEVQELKKAHWYLAFLIAYVANGDKPIRVKDIPKLLEK